MLFALLVAVLSVLLGAALSFAPGASRGLLGYMRTFATLAAVAVVVTHLLPEALHTLGPLAILLFLGGWFAPALAHFVGQRSTAGRPASAVLEAGYWGLVVHHVADGIGLGTYSRLPAAKGSHVDVIVALAAHTVPLIAVISLAYRSTFGARSAVVRSLGLALASVFGIALSSLVAAPTIEGFAPIIAAVAAGLLLHVVTHDLTEDPPLTLAARTLDLGVAALGVAVSLLGAEGSSEFARRLGALAHRTSVIVLLDLLFVTIGLVVRIGEAKAGRIRPLTSEDSPLLTFFLLGFPAGVLQWVLSSIAFQPISAEAALPDSLRDTRRGEHRRSGLGAYASEALARRGPWLILGLLGGALLQSAPSSGLVHHYAGTLPELAAVTLIANVTAVAAPAAVLMALGLSALGLSPGAVLLFAILGPLLASLDNARRLTQKRRLAVSALCFVVAALSNRLGLTITPLDGASAALTAPTLVLAALLLFGIWQRGARIWLSSIVKPPAHEHEHAHDVHGPHEH